MLTIGHIIATFVRSLLSSKVTSRSTYVAQFTNLRQLEDENRAGEAVLENSEGYLPMYRKD